MTKPYIKFLNILFIIIFNSSLVISQKADTISSDSTKRGKFREEVMKDSKLQQKETTEEQPELQVVGINPDAMSDFKNFSNLHISYYGTTQNCKPFNIYCFKYKRTWFLIANQEMNITFFTLRPPRVESANIVTGSNFLLQGLGKTYANQYTFLKKRRKVVKDLEIYGFYKFNRPGRKSVKGLLYLEYPELEPGPPWPFKWIAGKAEEKIDEAKGIIPEINTDALESAKDAVPE